MKDSKQCHMIQLQKGQSKAKIKKDACGHEPLTITKREI